MGINRNFIDQLRAMALQPGDSVLIHTSFRAFKPVLNHPEEVIESILACIGSRGNLMLPTFNYSQPRPEPYYDRNMTPCQTGAVPECGRQRDDAIRSLHPTHSVAVIGPDADELTRDHLDGRAFGVSSPVDRLAQRGGQVLLLGVTHIANSTIHVGEEHARLPKKLSGPPKPCVKTRMPDGRIINHQLDTSPSCSLGFDAIEKPLRHHGYVTDGVFENCSMQLMKGKSVIDQVVQLLADDIDALRCNSPTCKWCASTKNQDHAEY